MQRTQVRANPFAMLLDPESVIQAVENSERLNHLQRRICRPLDQVVAASEDGVVSEFDALTEALSDDVAIDVTIDITR